MQKYNRIYVGQIPQDCKKMQFIEMFEQYGKLIEIFYQQGSNHAYMEYENKKSASNAIRKLDSKKINGKKILVEYASKNLNIKSQIKGKSKQEALSKGLCFKCNKKGHLMKDCQQKQRRRSRSYSSSSSSSSYSSSSYSSSSSSSSSSYSSKSSDSSSDKSLSKSIQKNDKKKKRNKKGDHKKTKNEKSQKSKKIKKLKK